MRSFAGAALALLIAGCTWKNPDGIVVGSKDFTEQIILGNLVAEHVKRSLPLRVVRRMNLGGTLVCFSALTKGNLDVYPEYTGTVLTAILKEKPEKSAKKSYEKVRKLLLERYRIVCLPPLGFDNTYALMMRKKDAADTGIRTCSQLAARSRKMKAGFTSEFLQRPDGFKGLAKTYSLKFSRRPIQLDPGLMYRALKDGQVDVISGFSTDGRIDVFDLTVLRDDRRYFPSYEACLLVREASLEKHPKLGGVLRELSGSLDAATMRRLNASVDLSRKSPRSVAAEFLSKKKGDR